jgi:hypothetical protein
MAPGTRHVFFLCFRLCHIFFSICFHILLLLLRRSSFVLLLSRTATREGNMAVCTDGLGAREREERGQCNRAINVEVLLGLARHAQVQDILQDSQNATRIPWLPLGDSEHTDLQLACCPPRATALADHSSARHRPPY